MTNLEQELKNFAGGTDIFYYHPLFRKFVYTPGVRHLATQGGAFWLLEFIFSHQMDKAVSKQTFQVWKIEVKDDCTANISVEDGNDNLIKRYSIPFTDFPMKSYTLWFTDNTLLLPCEY